MALDHVVTPVQALDSNDIDPCSSIHCSAGRECMLDKTSGQPGCQCIEDCGFENDPRRMVCTNFNETFQSACQVHQLRCFCEDHPESTKCPDAGKYQHVHVEYFGECKAIPECDEGDLEDFPRRMREWLFNVMEELDGREELPDYYKNLHKEAKFDINRKWSNAAVWKWCDLDGHPHDNAVSRHELFPIRAPLQVI